MEFIGLFTGITIISVILFIIGISLIILEMFTTFGFSGFLGVLGIITLIVNIFITANTIREGIMLTAIFFVIVVILLAVFMTLMSSGRLPQRLVLHSTEAGFSGTEDMQYLLGKTGTVVNICRPVGNVDFDGVKLDVTTRGDFIEKGTTVEVIEVEGNRIVVRSV